MGAAQASYQTAPLVEYSAMLRGRASELFDRVRNLVGDSRVKEYKGSFSIFASTSDSTAAKIMIYEVGNGKLNGRGLSLDEGIYV